MDNVSVLETSRQTKRALFFSSLLHEPLFTLYSFVAFILYKDLHASAFQIALLTMLKPVSTILSFYWGAWSKGRLRANVLGAGFLMRAPFLLVPWVDSVWYVIGASVNYMLFYRAGMPAWLEILRKNVPAGERERSFSWSSVVGYAEGLFLAVAMGSLLDRDPGLWKGLFVFGSLLGMVGTLVQVRVPMVEGEKEERPSLRELVARPWRDSLELMRKRRDFASFQWGFMLCGFAIMLIQPALPVFAVDELGISHTQMAMAISAAKGLGYAASSPLWARWMGRMTMHRMASGIFLIMALFPMMIALARWDVSWFFVAYFFYGIGQGGSHLVWNLSGPYFSGKEESGRYTGVGVVLAGMRGAVGPPMGSWILSGWGAMPALWLGSLLCLWSGLGLFRFSKKSLAPN